MGKNRLLIIMLITLLTMSVIGVFTLVLYQYFQDSGVHMQQEKERTIDDILKLSVETEQITTNLLSNHIIRTQFVIELDNDQAKSELEMRDFQVENIIIQELSDLKESDFRGSDGIRQIEEQILTRINEIMQNGFVVNVYMNQRVIQ